MFAVFMRLQSPIKATGDIDKIIEYNNLNKGTKCMWLPNICKCCFIIIIIFFDSTAILNFEYVNSIGDTD